MTDADLIRSAIATAGLSARQFAERVLGRDERTIRRWSSGDVAIPQQARGWLIRWLGLSAEQRTAIGRALAQNARIPRNLPHPLP